MLLSIVALLAASPALALADVRSAGAAASIVATRLPPSATAMQIDGELTQEIWKKAPVVTGFVQRDPKEGAPATFETEVRVAFDDTALYVAVDALDPDPSKVVGILTRRDEGSPSDWVRVIIDSYRDRRTAYEFAVNIDCNDGQCTGLFYSRRIGRRPQRSVGVPEGGFAAAPDNTTILGAAKITGRIRKFSVGVLNAVTSREDARLALPAAGAGAGVFDHEDTPVEPATNYFLARASREFANKSRVAVMLTSTNRSLTEELAFLPGSAVTGGIDTDIRFGRRFSLGAFWAGSTVRGGPGAISRLQRSTVHSFQRPDAGHVEFDPARTSLGGHAGSLSFNKIAGQRYRFSSNAGYKSPGFEINDLGFQSRADEAYISNWHQLTWDTPGRFVRRRNINFNQWAGWNFDGDRRFSGGNINSHWTFTNNWTLGSGINYNTRGFNDRLTRGGPGGYVNPGWSQWGYLNTDNRKRVMANVSGSWFRDIHGSWNWSASVGSTYRPASNLSAQLGADVNRNHAESQWVANLAPAADAGTEARARYVFGALDQTTVGLSARINYTITPQLTVQVYARPFVSAGGYARFKELVNGRALDYASRYAPFAYDGNPDFNVRSFRTTNVLRWEYRPGSVFFVVWQQGRDGFASDGRFQFASNFGDIFEADATNVFLIKFSRWLNF